MGCLAVVGVDRHKTAIADERDRGIAAARFASDGHEPAKLAIALAGIAKRLIERLALGRRHSRASASA